MTGGEPQPFQPPVPEIREIREVRDVGFGVITPRIVDLLSRTRPWVRLVGFAGLFVVLLLAAVAILGAAFLARESLPLAVALFIAVASMALLLLALCAPLLGFGEAVKDLKPGNRGNRGEVFTVAIRRLGSFWKRLGVLTLVLLLIGVGLLLIVVWSVGRNPGAYREITAAAAARRAPANAAVGPIPLRANRFPPERSPVWQSLDGEKPSMPGRRLSYDDVENACPPAGTTFLCLLNQGGEPAAGGARRVITGLQATFNVQRMENDDQRAIDAEILGEGFTLTLRAGPPRGTPFLRSSYAWFESVPTNEDPFLEVELEGGSCAAPVQPTRFRLVDVVWSLEGDPERLVLDFEKPCGTKGALGPLIGRLSVAL
jgi:hypothetical protein